MKKYKKTIRFIWIKNLFVMVNKLLYFYFLLLLMDDSIVINFSSKIQYTVINEYNSSRFILACLSWEAKNYTMEKKFRELYFFSGKNTSFK
jgi:hypothetical protein